jgi:hypothetical protein
MAIENRTFVAQVKAVNEAKKTVKVVMSNESLDRYKEIILAESWKKRLNRYKKHPILLSSHSYNKLTNQIGLAEHIGVVDGNLETDFRYFAGEGNPEADWGWFLAKNGIAAFSVGFLPHKELSDDEVADYCKANKIKETPRRIYSDVELLECSQVLVPANADAMQLDEFSDEDQIMVRSLIDKVDEDVDIRREVERLSLVEIVTKPDTENYVHIAAPGQEGKHSGCNIRTMAISDNQGISGHYCVDDKVMTGYMFDKKKGWTHEKAAAWVEKHHGKSVEDLEIEIKENEDMDKVLEAMAEIKQLLEAGLSQINKRIDDVEVKLAAIEDIKTEKLGEETEEERVIREAAEADALRIKQEADDLAVKEAKDLADKEAEELQIKEAIELFKKEMLEKLSVQS